MRRETVPLALLVMLIAVTAVIAGEKEPCPHSAQKCLDRMSADLSEAPWLGVRLEMSDDGRAEVQEVVAESPAELAGLMAGDLILKMGDCEFMAVIERTCEGATFEPGTEVPVTVEREGREMVLSTTLGAMPRDAIAERIGRHMLEGHVTASDGG